MRAGGNGRARKRHSERGIETERGGKRGSETVIFNGLLWRHAVVVVAVVVAIVVVVVVAAVVAVVVVLLLLVVVV